MANDSARASTLLTRVCRTERSGAHTSERSLVTRLVYVVSLILPLSFVDQAIFSVDYIQFVDSQDLLDCQLLPYLPTSPPSYGALSCGLTTPCQNVRRTILIAINCAFTNNIVSNLFPRDLRRQPSGGLPQDTAHMSNITTVPHPSRELFQPRTPTDCTVGFVGWNNPRRSLILRPSPILPPQSSSDCC